MNIKNSTTHQEDDEKAIFTIDEKTKQALEIGIENEEIVYNKFPEYELYEYVEEIPKYERKETLCSIKIYPNGKYEIDFEPLQKIWNSIYQEYAENRMKRHFFTDEKSEDYWLLMDRLAEKYSLITIDKLAEDYLRSSLNKKAIIKALILKETKGIYYDANEKPDDFDIVDKQEIIKSFTGKGKTNESLPTLQEIVSLYTNSIIESEKEKLYENSDEDPLTETNVFETIWNIFGDDAEYATLTEYFDTFIVDKIIPEFNHLLLKNCYDFVIINHFKECLDQKIKKLDRLSIKNVKFNISLAEAYDVLPNIIKEKIAEDIAHNNYDSTLITSIIASFQKNCKRNNGTPFTTESILQCLKSRSEDYQMTALLSAIFSDETEDKGVTTHKKR